ncbi:pyruvate dehydrogenase (acetyl-transferring) E1 component subunit alpha [Agromyces atrinae]|uniref:Pyruvate dehydrogenase (Acetyl-transferring) E1 component subunit alpha n=1 Tax=Agromyces atrinae TaxID=592376 RepID=A0A4Q2M4L5_9MICO|nr:pyruvate dehydrogenase (acetyl-transferring) E1 component subunit alpha [Agromyces atrinae]NYD65826.1 pyruvate dehydrogenase E1 component alpha subunit [Agromyces atrinae]RXZ86177.1 pyruvate dehydrogenase (acetyl-transferring) E1 component subunit alpha [Agromyces atrinae]
MTPTNDSEAAVLTETGELIQLLSSDGRRRSAPGYDQWVADIGPAELLALHSDMSVVRRIDAEATALQRQGQLGLWPPLLGQEAAQIGSARSLRPGDFVFSSYREHAVAWCKGVRAVDVLRMWRGTGLSGWDPYEITMAPLQIIIGSQTLHAVGYAMGVTADGGDDVSVAYFGDGATSEGDVSEALVFAASFRAPVVFFCQNNQYAISEPVRVQSRHALADRASGFGVPSMRVDGNDVLAVMAATRIALERARTGGGPTFIEAVTYRMGPHTTADDPTRYRSEDELALWRERDPISRLEAHLTALGHFGESDAAAVAARADAEAAELRSACIELADPEPLSVFDHVYAEPHATLERQRDHYRRYLDGFEEVGS